MCAYHHRIGDPYRLKGHRLAFSNWYNVRPGAFTWHDAEGRDVTVKGSNPPGEATIRRRNHPWGVRLRVNEAQRTGPVFPRETEWEQDGFVINTILKDGDIYKAWGSTSWQSALPDKGERFLLYYESADGQTWTRPNCGVVSYKGSTDNNILFDGRAARGIQHGGSVFIDPTSTAERYKMFCETSFEPAECAGYFSRRPDDAEAIAMHDHGRISGIQGAVSPDGIHWTVLPDPLVLCLADTQVIGYHDEQLGKYVMYSRDWTGRPQATDLPPQHSIAESSLEHSWQFSARRAINRSETSDFRQFPLPQMIIEPSPTMPPLHAFYANCRTTMPGAPEEHLMFPTVWTMGESDGTHALFYSSVDGKVWSAVSPDPVLRTGPYGEWDGGAHLYITPNLTETAAGDFVLPYTGWNVPHKYPRAGAKRDVGYALWPKGRLCGVEALERGEFTTVAFIPQGTRVRINAVTERAGGIAVEVCDFDGTPLPGRSREDCNPIIGDAYRQQVRWSGGDDLGVPHGQPVVLRFHLDMATIYSLDFE